MGVGIDSAVGAGVGMGVAVGVGVGAGVGAMVGSDEGIGAGVGAMVGSDEGIGVGMGAGDGVAVGVGVDSCSMVAGSAVSGALVVGTSEPGGTAVVGADVAVVPTVALGVGASGLVRSGVAVGSGFPSHADSVTVATKQRTASDMANHTDRLRLLWPNAVRLTHRSLIRASSRCS